MKKRTFIKMFGAAAEAVGLNPETMLKTKVSDLDHDIYRCLRGYLRDAVITNQHLRMMSSRFCRYSQRHSIKEFCLRMEEIWMWADRPECRGGCRDCFGKRWYDPSQPDCQGCFIREERRLIESLNGTWAPQGTMLWYFEGYTEVQIKIKVEKILRSS